jgi:hypothetical protein
MSLITGQIIDVILVLFSKQPSTNLVFLTSDCKCNRFVALYKQTQICGSHTKMCTSSEDKTIMTVEIVLSDYYSGAPFRKTYVFRLCSVKERYQQQQLLG